MLPIRHLIKRYVWQVAPRVYTRYAAAASQEFAIGMYTGESPFSLSAQPSGDKPVIAHSDITDVPASFVADPFMCSKNGQWYMFFEVMSRFSWKGEIGLATSADGVRWSYRGIVLREPYHISYPYVFEWQHDYYMVPEGGRAGSVKLYRATHFPDHWACAAELLEGSNFLDPSIFRWDDWWWLFAATGGDRAPSLRLFISDALLGPWREHPLSPVVVESNVSARPAGRVIIVNGSPIRFAQEVFPVYGKQVRAFELLRLSPSTYEEREVRPDRPVLTSQSAAWNSGGMHHIDAHMLPGGSWLACVDGFPNRGGSKAQSK